MNIFDNMALGLSVTLLPSNLMWCLVGVTLGTFIGVLPGIGALTAISLLLPVTFHLDPTSAIVMLAGVFYGSSYGGSTASILLNLPGTPSTAITSLDGYPMSKQGRAGVALFMTTIGSFVGGSIGIIVLMLFSPMIVTAAMHFGPAEYFSLMLLGLISASTIALGSPVKGIAMAAIGIALGLVGADLETGTRRFTFDILRLEDGINLVAIAMGLFGVPEVIASIRQADRGKIAPADVALRSMIPTRDDLRRSWRPMLRGSAIGCFFGTLPGTGGIIASFISYAVEKKVAKDPSRFGNGAIEGIVAPETANNAADQTAFIPTLTLGIPGNVVMALMLGALMIHGITPGPQLMTSNPDLFWAVIMSFWIGNLLLLILNIPLIGVWVRILLIPYHLLYPAVLLFIAIGVYSINMNYVDVIMVMAFGGLGYFMRLLDFHPAPLLLGFVLGPLVEENLRRALILSHGDFSVFVLRPVSGTILAMILGLLLRSAWNGLRDRRRKAAAAVAS